MNIFVLDLNPELAAKYHCDKHVVKMIIETAQILSTVHHIKETDIGGIYCMTHKNHPCCIWARQSFDNYWWLCRLGLALCREYTVRYGKIHKTQSILEILMTNTPDFDSEDLTQFALAMPSELHETDAVESYRKYYMTHKRDICTWKTKKPDWFI